MSGVQLYYALLGALIPFSMALVVFAYLYLTREQIDAGSVKYAMDYMPMGIAFYREDGLPLLVNEAMQMLSVRFMKKRIMNGKDFHAFLFSPSEGASFTVTGIEDAFLLIDGSDVWTVRRQLTESDKGRIFQLIAYDTSELYARERELTGQVERLHAAEEKLKHFEEEVETLAEGEAYLATKERIHDELGQMLLSNRYYLTETDTGMTIKGLLAAWENTIGELASAPANRAERPEQGAFIKPLTDAATALGATLHVTGSFPADHLRLRRLVINAARVCITNAVRHGMADEISIAFDEADAGGMFSFRISNNGRVGEAFQEGGGLKNLRADVEKEGGTVTYEKSPRFTVIVTVPAV